MTAICTCAMHCPESPYHERACCGETACDCWCHRREDAQHARPPAGDYVGIDRGGIVDIYDAGRRIDVRWALVLALIALLVGIWSGIALERACQRGAIADPRCTPAQTDGTRGPRVVELRPPVIPLRLEVTATAYNSEPAQTDSTPWIAAWGDDIRDLQARGIDHIAVSRDLLAWLPPGSTVRIDGAHFVVADVMAAHWRRRIDIWMASRGAATRWGVRRVVLERIERHDRQHHELP